MGKKELTLKNSKEMLLNSVSTLTNLLKKLLKIQVLIMLILLAGVENIETKENMLFLVTVIRN